MPGGSHRAVSWSGDRGGGRLARFGLRGRRGGLVSDMAVPPVVRLRHAAIWWKAIVCWADGRSLALAGVERPSPAGQVADALGARSGAVRLSLSRGTVFRRLLQLVRDRASQCIVLRVIEAEKPAHDRVREQQQAAYLDRSQFLGLTIKVGSGAPQRGRRLDEPPRRSGFVPAASMSH
jgi:hypothetical protein